MRTILALIILPLLPALASAETVQSRVTDGLPVALAGTSLTLRLVDVQDQRCPADADCQWEGMVRAQISVTEGVSAPVIITLCNLCEDADRDASIGRYTIALGRLSPSRQDLATLRRAALLSDYRLSLEVSY